MISQSSSRMLTRLTMTSVLFGCTAASLSGCVFSEPSQETVPETMTPADMRVDMVVPLDAGEDMPGEPDLSPGEDMADAGVPDPQDMSDAGQPDMSDAGLPDMSDAGLPDMPDMSDLGQECSTQADCTEGVSFCHSLDGDLVCTSCENLTSFGYTYCEPETSGPTCGGQVPPEMVQCSPNAAFAACECPETPLDEDLGLACSVNPLRDVVGACEQACEPSVSFADLCEYADQSGSGRCGSVVGMCESSAATFSGFTETPCHNQVLTTCVDSKLIRPASTALVSHFKLGKDWAVLVHDNAMLPPTFLFQPFSSQPDSVWRVRGDVSVQVNMEITDNLDKIREDSTWPNAELAERGIQATINADASRLAITVSFNESASSSEMRNAVIVMNKDSGNDWAYQGLIWPTEDVANVDFGRSLVIKNGYIAVSAKAGLGLGRSDRVLMYSLASTVSNQEGRVCERSAITNFGHTFDIGGSSGAPVLYVAGSTASSTVPQPVTRCTTSMLDPTMPTTMATSDFATGLTGRRIEISTLGESVLIRDDTHARVYKEGDLLIQPTPGTLEREYLVPDLSGVTDPEHDAQLFPSSVSGGYHAVFASSGIIQVATGVPPAQVHSSYDEYVPSQGRVVYGAQINADGEMMFTANRSAGGVGVFFANIP